MQAERDRMRAEMDTLRAENAKDVANLRADKSEEILEVTKEKLVIRDEMLEATKELNTALLDKLDRTPIVQICVPGYFSLSKRGSLNNTNKDIRFRFPTRNVGKSQGCRWYRIGQAPSRLLRQENHEQTHLTPRICRLC